MESGIACVFFEVSYIYIYIYFFCRGGCFEGRTRASHPLRFPFYETQVRSSNFSLMVFLGCGGLQLKVLQSRMGVSSPTFAQDLYYSKQLGQNARWPIDMDPLNTSCLVSESPFFSESPLAGRVRVLDPFRRRSGALWRGHR